MVRAAYPRSRAATVRAWVLTVRSSVEFGTRGIDEGAIEGSCYLGQLAGGDPTMELGVLQFVDRGPGYSQPLG
jgi:hypothetical protein